MFSVLHFGDALPTWALLVELLVAGAIVVFSGSKLTGLADKMADKLHLGAGWIGLILLATVTSLPEVVAGGTAVAIGNPDLAFAAVFGSCSFNITIIVLMNVVAGGGSVLRLAGSNHTLTSSFGLVLISLALFGILLVDKYSTNLMHARVIEAGWAISILLAYLMCMRLTFQFEKGMMSLEEQDAPRERLGAGLIAGLVVLASVLILASWWLARTGDVLSEHEIDWIGQPLGATFVGACFLALATSLPEIATSVAAVRIGNFDLALGNIFGSNMFNIFTLPIFKAVSLIRGDSLLASGANFHLSQNLIAGVLPIILTAIAVGGLTYRSERRLLGRFGPDSALIFVVYLGGMYLLLS